MDRKQRSKRHRLVRIAGVLLLSAIPGCATMGGATPEGKPLIPTAFEVKTGPYIVRTNNKLEASAPVVRQLHSLETQVNDSLGLRVDASTNPVEVYILDDRKSFEHFLRFYYPELPHRRAFFLANGNKRVVYTFFGDRLEEDIRHEATHALLHLAIGDIPLWLDEGLAEYFESPTERRGINAEHLIRLPTDLQAGWTPDLARLESLKGVNQMTPRDYRESWAWVHYLLNQGTVEKAAMLGYLTDLKSNSEARPISSRLERLGGEALLAHIDQVQRNPIALDAPSTKDSTVRFQSGPTETVNPPARRKSVFGKIRDLFGP